MTSCGSATTASAKDSRFVTEDTANEALASSYRDPTNLNAWNVAMTRLLAWYKDPSQLMDEDISPPTREIIYKAYHLALAMRDNRSPGPLRVVPDGEGGVVFEWQEGSVFETIGIEANGRMEFMSFEGSYLSTRMPIALESDSESQHAALLSESTHLQPAA